MDRTADVRMQWGVRIPLRDGTHLGATLYASQDHQQPSPVIFVLTPYVAQIHHDQAMYFAAHGYAFLTVDVRGRGNSDGEFHPLNDAKLDGYDVVEWLAQQPYCNGQVAMWGASYSGYAQWAVAKHRPPHLATIVPVAAPFRGIDSPMNNNIFTPYTIRWLTYLSGRAAQDRIFADQNYWKRVFKCWFESGMPFNSLDTLAGNPSAIFQEWVSHPARDSYWDSYNPAPHEYARLSIPILTVTGAYDGDQHGALMHYREHLANSCPDARARHYLVIGPWDHSGSQIPKPEFGGLKFGPASVIDMPKLQLEWYAWTLCGGPKPAFLQNRVSYYVMGAEKWRYADTLEAVSSRHVAFYLHSTINPVDVFAAGSMAHRLRPDGEPGQYVYDPRDVSHAELESMVEVESRVDQRMFYACHGKQLVYHSEPFATATEVTGFFALVLWLSIDQPDTDFRAVVYEVGLDGSVIQLTSDSMRARYREDLRHEKLIRTRDPLCYRFERFTFVSRRVPQGHRLRLVIGPINSMYSQKNYNGGGVVSEESVAHARPVIVRLFHGESHPSVLHVPYGQPET